MGVEVKSNIGPYLNILHNAIDEEKQRILQEIYNDSQYNCPVDTGALKGSGYIAKDEVGYNKEYASHVEFKYHFLRNAFLKAQASIVKRMTDLLRRL